MGRFVRHPGKILVITGSRLARDHLERGQRVMTASQEIAKKVSEQIIPFNAMYKGE